MANDYVISCSKCKKALDIGTHHGIYFAEEDTMKELSDFLFDHTGHKLIFDDRQYFDEADDGSDGVFDFKKYTN